METDDEVAPFYPAKYAVIVVFVLAVVGSVGGWLYSVNLQRRPIQFWGAENAVLILRAPQVQLLKLEHVADDAAATTETIAIGARRWRVSATHDVTTKPGLKNIRSALVNDYSFAWDKSVEVDTAAWEFGLRFVDGNHSTTACFAPEQAATFAASSHRAASIESAKRGISQFVADALAPPAKP